MELIDPGFLTFIKDCILLLVHVIRHHSIMLLVTPKIKVVCMLSISRIFWLVLGDERFFPLFGWHSFLLSLQAHHLLDNLEARCVVLCFLNWESVLIKNLFWVRHAHETFPEVLAYVLDSDFIAHLGFDSILHLIFRKEFGATSFSRGAVRVSQRVIMATCAAEVSPILLIGLILLRPFHPLPLLLLSFHPCLGALQILALHPILVPSSYHTLFLGFRRRFLHLSTHEYITLSLIERWIQRLIDNLSLDDFGLMRIL